MIELGFLILLARIASWGYEPVIATRTVAADGAVLHGFLQNPLNQWCLAASFADLRELRPAGSGCGAELGLPFGLRCDASVEVQPTRSPHVLCTQVRIGRRTRLWVTWILTPARGTTEVDLAVQIESRTTLVRLALLLAGRRWIRRRAAATVGRLAVIAACVAEQLVSCAPAPCGQVEQPSALRREPHIT